MDIRSDRLLLAFGVTLLAGLATGVGSILTFARACSSGLPVGANQKSRNPAGCDGRGLALAPSRQSKPVRWTKVENITINLSKHSIVLRKGQRAVMLI